MKKYIFILLCTLPISGKLSSQNNYCSKSELINQNSVRELSINNNALDSIVNIIENEFLSAKNPRSWQVVELNIIQKDEKIFFQFTGLLDFPNTLKIATYEGGFFKESRFYIVKSKNEKVLTDFFNREEKIKLHLKKQYIPFIMENPIWLFSYSEKNKFKLEKVINEKALEDI